MQALVSGTPLRAGQAHQRLRRRRNWLPTTLWPDIRRISTPRLPSCLTRLVLTAIEGSSGWCRGAPARSS